MTDLTPTLNTLLPSATSIRKEPAPETADEFLKEAYRINTHIHSLLKYLHSIRQPYLTPAPTYRPRKQHLSQTTAPTQNEKEPEPLTDQDRDAIDASTSLLLRDLSSSITNLSSAESLRQETESSLLRSRYGHGFAGGILFRWAGGASALSPGPETEAGGKSAEQMRDEESARVTKTIRESVLWFLRRGLESAVERQRELVERRIERVREKERSVLYKSGFSGNQPSLQQQHGGVTEGARTGGMGPTGGRGDDVAVITESEKKDIESQLSPEQLQLFAEENDSMLRYYEDTLGKVQNAEKSLLEISSLQQSLVSHLTSQEDYIGQLVSDAAATQTNVGGGNRELRRAMEKRSTAQAVFWGTVGLCGFLVVWDMIF